MPVETWTHKDYTVGWICALPKEQTAAIAMLDQRHASLPSPSTDPNTYTLGSVGDHNIVIACLPKGKYGTISAAVVATHMSTTFTAIRFGLMVGIGGGVPGTSDVRLGDVVVSVPDGTFPGVVQWDMGKSEQGGRFTRTGALNNPPTLLLTALTRVETEHEMLGSSIPDHLDELGKKYPRLATKYLRTDTLEDVLFEEGYDHTGSNSISGQDESCQGCDLTRTVARPAREMKVHFGLIASGNQVIKDASQRKALVNAVGGRILCIEMEAAGLMDNFPCLVIRGICDYADSHKNKAWQEHAAAVAAAFAKELLAYVLPDDINEQKAVKDLLSDMSENVQLIKEDAAQTRQLLATKDDMEILQWLSNNHYGAQQSDILKRRYKGTGRWFVEDSQEYQDWLRTKGRSLYCPGPPGAGKTIIASAVVQDISCRFLTTSGVGLAYIYFMFSRKEEQTVEHVLASLLMQLLRGQPSLHPDVRVLYNRHVKTGTVPSFEDLTSAMQTIIPGYNRTFIVLDALDECNTNSACLPRIMTEILNLQTKFEINVLATSRVHDGIGSRFNSPSASALPITALPEDMDLFLCGRMEAHDPEIFDHEFRNTVASEIIKYTEGIFLLAELHLNAIVGLHTRGAVQDALKTLEKGSNRLDTVYDMAMERINDSGHDSHTLANKILLWIVHALRPLSTAELRHALAIQSGTEAFQKDYMPSARTLRSICAGLITTDEQTGVVRLIHYTAQEYFDRYRERWFPNAHQFVTNCCITYLSYGDFGTGHCLTDDSFENRLKQYPLYTYAAQNWGQHARATSACQKLLPFLQKSNQKNIEASTQALFAVKHHPRHSNYSQQIPGGLTGLHLAAFFGFRDVVENLLLEHHLEARDAYHRTPLWWAGINRHNFALQTLLDHGADTEARDTSGHTLLLWATWKGLVDTVEALLKHSPNIEAAVTFGNARGSTALWLAAIRRDLKLVHLLLQYGADPNGINKKNGKTVLWYAANDGNMELMQLFLQNGADVNVLDTFPTKLLWYAARKKDYDFIKKLCQTYADLNSPKNEGETLLWHAAMANDQELVQFLMRNVPNNQNIDKNGNTVSWYVGKGYDEELMQLLCQNCADINALDSDVKSLLWHAVMTWDKQLVQLLAQNGANLHHTDHDGKTILWYAAKVCDEKTMRLLIKHGANIDHVDDDGRAMLWYAAKVRDEGVMRLLIKHGANLHHVDNYGQTILWYAANTHNEKAVRLLIKYGDNINSLVSNGKTLWWHACHDRDQRLMCLLLRNRTSLTLSDVDCDGLRTVIEKRNVEFMRLLFENGVNLNPLDRKDWKLSSYIPATWIEDVTKGLPGVMKLFSSYTNVLRNACDRLGRTLLSQAVIAGNVRDVEAFLKFEGIEVNSRDINGLTALSHAVERSERISRLLLAAKNIDVNIRNNHGRTPLMIAAHNGSIAIIRLLLDFADIDVNSRDDVEQTALMIASEGGRAVVVKLLLDAKDIDVNIRDNEGYTALEMATRKEYRDIVEVMTSHEKIDGNMRDKLGQTPLMIAAATGHTVAMINLVMRDDIDLNLPDLMGRTALSWAAHYGEMRAVKILLGVTKKAVDLTHQDLSGDTPLSLALKGGHGDVADLLQTFISYKSSRTERPAT